MFIRFSIPLLMIFHRTHEINIFGSRNKQVVSALVANVRAILFVYHLYDQSPCTNHFEYFLRGEPENCKTISSGVSIHFAFSREMEYSQPHNKRNSRNFHSRIEKHSLHHSKASDRSDSPQESEMYERNETYAMHSTRGSAKD